MVAGPTNGISLFQVYVPHCLIGELCYGAELACVGGTRFSLFARRRNSNHPRPRFPRLCSQAAAMPTCSKGWASAAASPAPASPSLPVPVVDSLSSSTSSDDEGSSDSQSEVEPFPPGPFEDEDTDNNREFSVFEMAVETMVEIAAAS